MRCSACEAANYVRLWHLADIDADAEDVRNGGGKADMTLTLDYVR